MKGQQQKYQKPRFFFMFHIANGIFVEMGLKFNLFSVSKRLKEPLPGQGVGRRRLNWESRPAELPRQPLAKRCGSLSTHTASIRQTHLAFLLSSAQIGFFVSRMSF